jgi:hypothetical protein
MKLAVCVLVAAATLLATPSLAWANSEFEGEWVLDVKRSSDLGRLMSATQTIVLEGKNLRVSRTITRGIDEPVSYEYVYVTDGTVHNVVGPPEFVRDVTAEWKGFFGQKLEVKWTMEVQGISVESTETWEKKSKGLRLTREFKAPMIRRGQKLYFVRPGHHKR